MSVSASTSKGTSLMDKWWKMGGIAGIIFVVLFLVGIGLQNGSPTPDDSAAVIKAYFADNANRYMWGDFVFACGFLFFFLMFASSLRSFLRRAEGEAAVRSNLFFAIAIIFTAIGGAAAGLQGALAYSGGALADDNLLKTMVDANYYSFTVIGTLSIGAMVLPASIVILQTHALWTWLGALGILVTIAAVIGSLGILSSDPMSPLGTLGFIAMIGFGVWTLATGAGMLLAEAPPEASAS